MFEFFAEVDGLKANGAKLRVAQDALGELRRTYAMVGVPEDKAARTPEHGGKQVTNASLLYIHTNGSPLEHIPARPVLQPAITDSREQIGQCLAEAAQKAIEGDREGMLQKLDKAGMQGQNAARAWFTDPKNGWAPNSQATIDEKGSSRPLIDEDEMRKSITYVVRSNQ
jgi:hypothetical protein